MFLPVMKRRRQIMGTGKIPVSWHYLSWVSTHNNKTQQNPFYTINAHLLPLHFTKTLFLITWLLHGFFFIFMTIEFCKVSRYLSILLRLKAITVVRVQFYYKLKSKSTYTAKSFSAKGTCLLRRRDIEARNKLEGYFPPISILFLCKLNLQNVKKERWCLQQPQTKKHKWSKKLDRAKSEERNKRYAFNTKVLQKITLHAFIKEIKI